MNCLNCNALLAAIDYCPNCGADMSILKRIVRISNMNYNEGLDKASVRDLSGAIVCLKRSLRFHKYNIDARNLLGLVYFETGEVVSALSEWVISKNLQPKDNIADYYITKLQKNPNKLDTINQTIKKYNQALSYCFQQSEDMAVIQLKKLLNQNPRLIKGYQLLALLYLREQEYEKARRVLKKAARIDTTNTMTLRYIREVDEATGKYTVIDSKKSRKREKEGSALPEEHIAYKSGNDTIIQPAAFRETSIITTFVNIAIGFLVGLAVFWFLVLPAKEQQIYSKTKEEILQYSDQLNQISARFGAMEALIAEYEGTIDDAQQSIEDANAKADSYDLILEAAVAYMGVDENNSLNETQKAELMESINGDSLEGHAKELYDILIVEANKVLITKYTNESESAYVAGDYELAKEKALAALKIDEEYVNAMYWLAYSYSKLGEEALANQTFTKLITLDPGKASEYQGQITQEETS